MSRQKTYPGGTKKSRSPLGEIWHRMLHNKSAMVGMIILSVLLLLMIISFFVISFEDVMRTNNTLLFAKPSVKHLFGTDNLGRDMLARCLYGIRYSLCIGVLSVLGALIIGVVLGALAGYYGGKTETVIMRLNDVLASIPGLLLGMVVVTVMGNNLFNLIIAVLIPAIPGFVRITRASVLTVIGQDYVEAARSIGMSDLRIIFTQVVPNGLSPIIVQTTSSIGTSIIVAAGLSFLGFGLPVPTPEWGAMITIGRDYIRAAPHLTLFPGLFIMISVLAFNIMGDGLRDALDPKLKR